jgi:hypothetical protein
MAARMRCSRLYNMTEVGVGLPFHSFESSAVVKSAVLRSQVGFCWLRLVFKSGTLHKIHLQVWLSKSRDLDCRSDQFKNVVATAVVFH